MKIELDVTVVTTLADLSVCAGQRLILHNGAILGVYQPGDGESSGPTLAPKTPTNLDIMDVLQKFPQGLNIRQLGDELHLERTARLRREALGRLVRKLELSLHLEQDLSESTRFPRFRLCAKSPI